MSEWVGRYNMFKLFNTKQDRDHRIIDKLAVQMS